MQRNYFLLAVTVLVAVACDQNGSDFDATGNFEADEIIISAEASGKIVQLAVEEGTELKEKAVGGYSKENYATRVCRNCDARYSCSSYREYAAQTQGKNLYNFKQFWLDPISDVEQEEWLEGNINNEQLEISANAADELD